MAEADFFPEADETFTVHEVEWKRGEGAGRLSRAAEAKVREDDPPSCGTGSLTLPKVEGGPALYETGRGSLGEARRVGGASRRSEVVEGCEGWARRKGRETGRSGSCVRSFGYRHVTWHSSGASRYS